MRVTFVQAEAESLAVEYLSSVLKSHGHKTSLVFDPMIFNSPSLQNSYLQKKFDIKKALVEQIKDTSPDLIGFPVFTGNYQWALSVARSVKKVLEVPIIFGGIHPTSVPETVMKEDCVDMICIGEGEYALVELVENLAQNKENQEIKNIWFKKDGKIIKNDVRPPIKNLDDLPFPDKDLYYKCQPFSTGSYNYMIMTTRGCPFSCTFCGAPILRGIYAGKGRYIRRRSVKNVIDELVWMKDRYKPTYVDFPDDVFTSDIKWLEEFSKEYKRKVALPFLCITHIAFIKPLTIELLKAAGCYWLLIGVQTVSESTRRELLNRYETNEQLKKVAKECHRVKLNFSVDHIFNIPHDGEKEQIEAMRFYNEIRPSLINTYWLKYFPQTEILNTALDAGILDASTITDINEGKLSTSLVIGIGARDTLDPEQRFHNFAFLLNLLPLLPKRVVDSIISHQWFLRRRKPPIWLNTTVKFIRRLRLRQGHIYISALNALMHNMIRNWRLRKKYHTVNE